jgi:hypothetical protein
LSRNCFKQVGFAIACRLQIDRIFALHKIHYCCG